MRITISSLLFRNCLLDKVIARSEKAETHILSIHEKRFFLDELQRAAFICLGILPHILVKRAPDRYRAMDRPKSPAEPSGSAHQPRESTQPPETTQMPESSQPPESQPRKATQPRKPVKRRGPTKSSAPAKRRKSNTHAVQSSSSKGQKLPLRPAKDSRKRLTEEEWQLRLPQHRDSLLPSFSELSDFVRPPVRSLTKRLAKQIAEHEMVDNRLPGVTFLNHGAHDSKPWVAGLVGLKATLELYTWLDRDVTKVACPLFSIYTDNRRGHPTAAGMIHATLKVNDIFHRLQALLYSTPGTLLGKRTADKKAIDKTTLDKMTTGLVLIVRAPSTTLEGIGHNSWQAAMVVFRAFKNRRSRQQTHPASPKPKPAEWFGLITDGEVIAAKANIDLPASVRFSLDDTTFEATLQSAGFDARQDQLDKMATVSDFFKVFPQSYRGELPANGKCIKDDDLTLGDHVNDSIVEAISQMNQTASFVAELKQHSNIVYTPLDPVQLNPFRGWLK
ncbi:hypothetical protein NW759_002652 [Fusarium solani]|nr:hypothetical protein NW759_002652 [Fusarium solani]